jgi:hypothetical protein
MKYRFKKEAFGIDVCGHILTPRHGKISIFELKFPNFNANG